MLGAFTAQNQSRGLAILSSLRAVRHLPTCALAQFGALQVWARVSPFRLHISAQAQTLAQRAAS